MAPFNLTFDARLHNSPLLISSSPATVKVSSGKDGNAAGGSFTLARGPKTSDAKTQAIPFDATPTILKAHIDSILSSKEMSGSAKSGLQ